MIKVIKHGTIKEHITTCPHCQCEFSYEKEDIETNSVYNLTSTSIFHYIVRCPECGTEIEVYNYEPLQSPQLPYWPNCPYSPYNPYRGPIVTYCNCEGTSGIEAKNEQV